MERANLILLKAEIATEVDQAIDRRFGLFALPKMPMSPDYEPRNIGVDEGLTYDAFSETSVELDSVRGELAGLMAEDTNIEGVEAVFEAESTGFDVGNESTEGYENE